VDGWLLIGLVVLVIGVSYLASHFGWVDLSNKNRSGSRGGVMGLGDEIFNPTRHEAQIELDRQTVLPAPAPLPGDPGEVDSGVYRGQVHINLNEPRNYEPRV